jgi:hypothetical protein
MSSQSISKFIANITGAGGLSRPNRFSVSIYPPNQINMLDGSNVNNASKAAQIATQNEVSVESLGGITNYFSMLGLSGSGNYTSRLDFMVCDAELPGKTFNTQDIRTYGSTYEVPSVDVYSDITLSFIVGRDMLERDFFDAWSYTIQDPNTSDFNYSMEYGTTVDINQLDEFDQSHYGCRLYYAWPKTIGELKLSYNSFNSFHVLPVTFTYKKWINLKVNTSVPTSFTSTLSAPSLMGPDNFNIS